jgi:hypothetical protein
VTVGVQGITDTLAPGPVPQAVEQLAPASNRASQYGSCVGATQVKLTSPAAAAADPPGQQIFHIGDRHESQRSPIQAKISHAWHTGSAAST